MDFLTIVLTENDLLHLGSFLAVILTLVTVRNAINRWKFNKVSINWNGKIKEYKKYIDILKPNLKEAKVNGIIINRAFNVLLESHSYKVFDCVMFPDSLTERSVNARAIRCEGYILYAENEVAIEYLRRYPRVFQELIKTKSSSSIFLVRWGKRKFFFDEYYPHYRNLYYNES